MKNFSDISIASTALTVGAVSAAAFFAGSETAQAEGTYIGLSYGLASGDNPVIADGDSDNYELSGGVFGMFIGRDVSIGTSGMFVGAELAYSGKVEGDDADESSYEYAYDVNWTLDAKLRVGSDLGNVKVYGFAGLTSGNANNYYTDYSFSGMNYGVGASYQVSDGFSVGLEVIQRDFNEYSETEGENPQSTTIDLRASFSF